ncbi:MAG: PilZ domain-containing protein [Candidatus Scalinduaceae bacterium]
MTTKKRVRARGHINIIIKHLADAINISEGGMGVIIDNPLLIGHKIELDLHLPTTSNDDKQESSNPITLEGEVVWTKYSESLDKHQIGIKFTDTNAQGKETLKSFVEKYT